MSDETVVAYLPSMPRVITIGKGKNARRFEYAQPTLTVADVSKHYADGEVGLIRAAWSKRLTQWKAGIKAAKCETQDAADAVLAGLDLIPAPSASGRKPRVTVVARDDLTPAERKMAEGLTPEFLAKMNVKLD